MTPPPFRFGYKASAEQFGPGDLADLAVSAEAHGFDSVFISDHLQPWRHDGGHAPASLPWLGAVGARTSRVILGTSVLTPTIRYHPAVIAQAFATLGSLFPGRIVLGVGTGESLNEVPLGLAWPEQKERFARLKESVQLIRELWTGERVSFEGTYYRTDKATIYDRPDDPVPIYIGASGPAATRLAGRVADGFITTSGKAPSLYTDTLLPALGTGRRRRAAAWTTWTLLIEMKVSFDPDREPGRPGHPVLGGAGADAGAEGRRRGPDRDAAAGRRVADRAGRVPVDRLRRSGRARRADQAPTWTWASGTWSSMLPGPTRSGS